MYTMFDLKRPHTTGDTATDVMTYGKRMLGSGSRLFFRVKIPFCIIRVLVMYRDLYARQILTTFIIVW